MWIIPSIVLAASVAGAVSPPAGAGLLIVAPRALAGGLEAYVAHKRERLATELVVLEEVLAGSDGADDPERLKRFLYDAHRSRDVRYVLLVGDADVMPVRYMVLDRVTEPAFDYAFYPSDLYYADVAEPDGSFEDWNAKKDGFHAMYYGEVRGEKNKSDPINFDAIDYRPELALGRWPVSTPEEVAVVATKSITYERGVESDAADKRRRPIAAVLAVGGWIENRPAMDDLAAQLEPAWRVEKRYFADAARSDTPPPDELQVVELLNDFASLVLHSGHGADDRWEASIGVWSLAKLTNQARPAILLSAGCSTARFATLPPYEAYEDIRGVAHKGTNGGEVFAEPPAPPAPYARGPYNMTGLGEQSLKAGPAGAVAYFGCNTGSQPCGMTLLAGFVDAIAGGTPEAPPRLGDCWAQAVSHYYDQENLASIAPSESWYPASIFFQGMKFMLFGDPSLPMPR